MELGVLKISLSGIWLLVNVWELKYLFFFLLCRPEQPPKSTTTG